MSTAWTLGQDGSELEFRSPSPISSSLALALSLAPVATRSWRSFARPRRRLPAHVLRVPILIGSGFFPGRLTRFAGARAWHPFCPVAFDVALRLILDDAPTTLPGERQNWAGSHENEEPGNRPLTVAVTAALASAHFHPEMCSYSAAK